MTWNPGRHFVEWMLFLLVFVISFHDAWVIGGGNTYDFFWCSWDGLGYYQWLPAACIDRNLDWMIWTYPVAEGRAISLFTLGVACLQLPFFLAAHGLALFFGYPAMGFDPPYAVAMMAATATYAGMGVVLAYRLAARFADRTSALLAVLAIYGGSNLFFYAVHQPLMSHVYSFFLVTLFCWTALRVIDGPKGADVVLFLVSGALLVLVRQVNVFVFAFPFWMAWTSPGGLGSACGNLVRRRGPLILGILLASLPWILQSMYWHHITGHWYANGYAYKQEFFEFGKMVPGMVLFSPRNGWFVYSPIFLPMMAILLVHAWRNTASARPVLLIFLLTVLLYSAWWCWWLGGAYGYRGLVDLYGLFAIPMAWLFRSVVRRTWAVRVVAALCLWALVSLNFGMMRHYEFYLYSEYGHWPEILAIVGKIAAGN